ncbi:MAG: hypothetical protein HOB37_16910 [Rhodospirillaceae bacterium]|nr:hypothetical protein [Rhodospirillaceae bacterium]MBT5512836.1 hypothetical protein [Rhodospirillaceae bacterium]MBT6087101.1 hypothetical protein [Rhodospirillaceae bacterium]MBT6610116.1 hypothetical protein [Rhodospirillaceae bacterium]MBT6885568.1 hypothetical protein [Rhodospirillaceae bacterium]
MFLHVLSEDQKHSFFDLAQQMMVADGIVAEAEVAYLDRLYWEAGLMGKATLNDVEEEVYLSIFADRRTQLVVCVELIIISIIDGVYHAKEAAFANATVDAFRRSAKEHTALCSIAEHMAQALVDMRNLMD